MLRRYERNMPRNDITTPAGAMNRAARNHRMPDNNIPSLEYRDTDILHLSVQIKSNQI